MKNLELVFAQIQDRGMSAETYTDLLGDILHSQKLVTIDVKNGCGVIVQDDSEILHCWVITRSQDNSLFYVKESNTWYKADLSDALLDLATAMTAYV